MQNSNGREMNGHLRRAAAKLFKHEAFRASMHAQYGVTIPKNARCHVDKTQPGPYPVGRERGGFTVPRPFPALNRVHITYTDSRGRNYL